MVKKVFKSVGLIARYDKQQALKLAKELADYLRKHGLEIYIEDTLAGKVNFPAKTVPLESMKTDFVITIGGDGTILRACLSLPEPEPPILAVNMGVRGFLTEVEPKGACTAVEKTLKGEFKIEKCAKLAVSTNGQMMPNALNDVVISAGEPSKILYTRICKDDEPILKCQADGLIASTQTGSTGYSLSAGGPVLDPEVDAFVLTPISSLTVFRSLIFSAESKVTIEAIRPKEMLVLIDGNYRQLVKSRNPMLTITRSKNVTSFIRFREDFYHRLRSRLLFKGMG
jgi:NAD+ kinase